MANSTLARFLGDTPLRVLVRLVFMSFIVGVVMAALGIEPTDIVRSIVEFFQNIYEMGFAAIDRALRYFLLGAIVVVPIWLIIRISKAGRP